MPDSNVRFGAGRGPPAGCVRPYQPASGDQVGLALLGERQLLAHARLDGRLHAVSVIAGRARLHDLGPLDDVNERIEAVTFSLHRLNRIQGSDESRLAAAEMLYAFADELAEIVLPPIVAESFDPVVIVPTAILHDVPWGLLPPLAGRSVSVNASVSSWGHAERTLRQRRGTLRDGIAAGFVAGPGLDFADVEVKHLAGGYVDPVVLVGEEATVAACTALLSRAELVHIACQGRSADNPMFSSLHVAEGHSTSTTSRVRAAAGRGRALFVQRRQRQGRPGWLAARPRQRLHHPRRRQRDRPADADLRRRVGDGDGPPPPSAHRRRRPRCCPGGGDDDP